MKTYIAAFFLLLSATFVAAHPYLIQRLGIEQGLSNNYVLSITPVSYTHLTLPTIA